MSYQALYRKYRPQTFSDVCGQEHITNTLKSELQSGKTVHAYLFTGTRGTGKTTCAKILAKAINCQSPVDGDPCGKCDMCKMISSGEATDIVEIDAASNNGVDSIRELRDQVVFSPAVAKYRVYIIDEVHMLSSGAFNALLKTLEEPPEHVVFILATTEVHKLPATILSRCQRFDFKRIDSEKICERLEYISKLEGLDLTDDAATLIAGVADGGMRDALSILDLCSGTGNAITEADVAAVCSMAGNDYLLNMADLILEKDTGGALSLLDELHNSSVDMSRLLSELISHFRDLMIIKTIKSGNRPIICSKARMLSLESQAQKFSLPEIMAILNILQNSTALMSGSDRRSVLEMAIIRLCTPKLRNDIQSLELRIAALEASGNAPKKVKAQENPTVTEKSEDTLQDDTVSEAQSESSPAEATGEVSNWSDILEILKTKSPLIAGVLKGSKAYIEGGRLLIDTANTQFKSLVNGANAKYREDIKNAAEEILGRRYNLGPYTKKTVSENEEDPLLAFAEKLKSIENN